MGSPRSIWESVRVTSVMKSKTPLDEEQFHQLFSQGPVTGPPTEETNDVSCTREKSVLSGKRTPG